MLEILITEWEGEKYRDKKGCCGILVTKLCEKEEESLLSQKLEVGSQLWREGMMGMKEVGMDYPHIIIVAHSQVFP